MTLTKTSKIKKSKKTKQSLVFNNIKSKKAEQPIAMMIIEIATVLSFLIIAGFMMIQAEDSKNNLVEKKNAMHDTFQSGVVVQNIESIAKQRKIDTLIITIEPQPGSDPIKLDQMKVQINQRNTTTMLKYRNGTLEKDIDKGYYTE